MILTMAWRNLWRNPRRTLLTVAIIGLGLSLLMWLLCYTEGMSEKMQDQLARSSIGHLQIHHPQFRSQRQVDMLVPDAAGTVEIIAALPEVQGVRPRLIVPASIRSSMSSTVRVVPLLGVDRNREMGVSRTPEQVVAGGFVVPPEEAQARGAPLRHRRRRGITLGDKLAGLLGVELGSKVRLDMACLKEATCSAAWTVTGIVDTGSDTVDETVALVDLAGLQEVLGTGDRVHEVSVLFHDGAQTAAGAHLLKGLLGRVQVPLRPLELSWVDEMSGVVPEGQDGLAGLAIEPWWEINPDIQSMLGMMDMASGFSYVLMLILMSAGILTTMFTLVYERRRELGVQAALGTSPGRIFAASMAEAVWLAILGVVVGTALGTVWSLLMTYHGIDLSGMSGNISAGGLTIDSVLKGKLTLRVFTEPALVVFSSTLLFALFPSLKMARLPPVAAMADQG
jgi:putative ABC transport system permease protein